MQIFVFIGLVLSLILVDEMFIEYEPSPDEIAAACEAIQASWSPEEFVSRQILRPSGIDSDGAEVERLARESLDYTLSVRRRTARRAG